jgi:ABC-type nitrate/sulfonate/bicarbonate transport system permease component
MRKDSPLKSYKELKGPLVSVSIRLLSILLFCVLWEVIGRQSNPLLFSYPTAIAKAFWVSLMSGDLIVQALTSLKCFTVGTILAMLSGVAIGVLVGRYKIADYLLQHFLNAFYVTPMVALIPLIIMWFGLGLLAKIVIVFLVCFFPVAFNTADGVRNLSRSLVDVGRAYGATEKQLIREIMIPAIIPFIMSGLRLGMGRALTGMIVAEMFTAITGLGAMIVIAPNTLQTDQLFVGVITIGIFGTVLLQSAIYLEKKLSPWKETEKAW